MRILLDECVNQRMRNHLPGHECQSARYAGFGGLKNGELLDAAEAAGFDVLVTVDRGFRYEQELREAIHEAGAFRMFRSTIRRLGIETSWYRFHEEGLVEIARDWLEAHELPYR
jgi:hypothetical protein